MLVVLAGGVLRAVKGTVREVVEFMGSMSAEEARRILSINESEPLVRDRIRDHAIKLRSKNKSILPKTEYIVKKIDSAEKVLLREIE